MSGARFYLPIFTAVLILASFSRHGAQGIGDRNRPADGDGRYSIQGRVYLPNGKSAVNAKVAISSADAVGTSTTTDFNGVFQVGSLRAGNYSISVSVAGFPPESETVTIDRSASPGGTFSVVIHIPAEARGRSETAVEKRFAGVPKAAVEKYKAGVEKLRQNQPEEAIRLLSGAVEIQPTFAAAHFELGSAYLKLADLDKALAAFVAAVSADPGNVEAKYSVGYTQYLKKNYEVASAVFADVLRQKRDFPEALMYLGVSLYYLKNLRDAETALKAAVANAADQRTALAHRFLGGLYAQSSRNAEAAIELQKYLDLVPSAPDAGRIRSTIEELRKKS